MAALTSTGLWRAGQQLYPAAVVYVRLVPRAVIAPPVAAAAALAATATTAPAPSPFTRYPVTP